jgi:hypothetical protein
MKTSKKMRAARFELTPRLLYWYLSMGEFEVWELVIGMVRDVLI